MPDVNVDVSKLPRLGLSPVAHSDDQAEGLGLNRHASMVELSRRTFMWNPELAAAQAAFAAYLRESTVLTPRDREIAILRQAWTASSDYQWGMHATMALNCGLTQDDIRAVAAGDPSEPRWAPHEAAIISAVDELHATTHVGDETWAALVSHFSEKQLVELLTLIGSYRMIAFVFNAVGIPAPEGSDLDLPGNTFLHNQRK